MAEFKLGRIRFVWKDEWNPSTVYYSNTVLPNGIKRVTDKHGPDIETLLHFTKSTML